MTPIPENEEQTRRRPGGLFEPEEMVTLRFLTPQQVQTIDHALTKVPAFAEIRLVKVRGRLQFLQVLESYRFYNIANNSSW